MDNFVVLLVHLIGSFVLRHRKGVWALVMLSGILMVFSAVGGYECSTIEFGEFAAYGVIGISLFALGGFAGGFML